MERGPHSSLGYVTAIEFAARRAPSVRATPSLQQHNGHYLTQPQCLVPPGCGLFRQTWLTQMHQTADQHLNGDLIVGGSI